ncbi:hypothetical protein A8135_12145 [Legionella jamestowniensis]|uniref:Uncharacterized protein n=2 Tax=Legionella jamestowniensis TaxID=455 RepID=A0ABX2Y241_9GAMM|nr:hypothetical protein A8135_12145 [Legionella jamestowniensis]
MLAFHTKVGLDMKSLDIADLLIPGYTLLSEEVRADFEKSPAGKLFVNTTDKISQSLSAFQESISWWHYLVSDIENKGKLKQQEIELEKAQLLQRIEREEDYKKLTTAIILELLPEVFPDIAFLSQEEQKRLAQSQFSQELLSLVKLDRKIYKAHEQFFFTEAWHKITRLDLLEKKLHSLNQKKTALIQHWLEQFEQLDEVRLLRESIAYEKERQRLEEIANQFAIVEERMNALAQFFIWLNEDQNVIAELTQQYLYSLHTDSVDFSSIEEKVLTIIIFNHLQQVTNASFDYVNLHYFNLEQARLLANTVLRSFNFSKNLQLQDWFTNYQRGLEKKLQNNLLLINQKQWMSTTSSQEELLGSLSSLFWQSKTVEKTKEFLNKLADAHAFIQATGFSTQNESSFLAILDIYNYGRTAEQIAETRRIISSLLNPFLSLYREYRDIAFYEKSGYRKILRTVMPLLVVAAFVTLVAALLAPLAIPELAFTIILIPTLFLGMVLATKYVEIKDKVYKILREVYYGSPFQIPEFQVNARMVAVFGTEEKAQVVRDFYVQELQVCDETEAFYQASGESGILRQEELENRKENLIRRHSLCLEWYDIHSNVNLGYEKVPQLVLNRLTETGGREYEALKLALQQEFPIIQRHINLVVQKLTTSLNADSDKENAPTMETADSVGDAKNHSPLFFKPIQTLTHRNQAQKIDAIATMVKTC